MNYIGPLEITLSYCATIYTEEICSPLSTQRSISKMNKKPKVGNLQETEILQQNKKIDARVVGAQTKLERQLKDLGVEVKPKFNIDPPLGHGKIRLCKHNF